MVSRNTRDEDLYRLWAQTMAELKGRGMWENGSPLGWAARQLACERLNLDPEPNNRDYYDATAPNPINPRQRDRYQIKGRQSQVSKANINGLQDLPGGHFEFLVVVLYEEDYLTVRRAFKIPHAVVLEVAEFGNRNGYGFWLNQGNIARPDVQDITDRLV